MGNLSLEITGDELRKKFTAFGEVISVTIMDDRYIGSGQPRGYGYVEMTSTSEGTNAIYNLNGAKLRGRVINVVESLPLSDRKAIAPTKTRRNSRYNKKRERNY